MLSVEVYTAKQQLTINVYGSRLLVSFSDNDITRDQSFADEKIIKKDVCDNSLDDQLLSHNPTQCSSAIVDGELVMTTNPSSSHDTLVYKYYREGCNHMDHLYKCSKFCHGECLVPHTMMEKHYQQCIVAKRNIVATMQDDCTFNINCIAVQESLTT